jgi:hypothetical protein
MAFARGGFTARELARVAILVATLAVALIFLGGGWILRLWGILP